MFDCEMRMRERGHGPENQPHTMDSVSFAVFLLLIEDAPSVIQDDNRCAKREPKWPVYIPYANMFGITSKLSELSLSGQGFIRIMP